MLTINFTALELLYGLVLYITILFQNGFKKIKENKIIF